MGGYRVNEEYPIFADGNRRKRYRCMNFKLTPEEEKILRHRIKLSGRTQQDALMQSALTSQLIVVGNSTLLETIKETIQEVLPELRKWEKAEDIDPVTIGYLHNIFEITEHWE